MRGALIIFVALLTLAFVTGVSAAGKGQAKIRVTSSAFREGDVIPDRYTCKGANINPPLQFAGVPSDAKSLVLVLDDPDAPGGLFTHWMVWNIDPATKGIAERSSPRGAAQGTNDFGNPGYGGPCPPAGTHRYVFHLLALDQKIELKARAERPRLDQAMAGHVVGVGTLMGRATH